MPPRYDGALLDARRIGGGASGRNGGHFKRMCGMMPTAFVAACGASLSTATRASSERRSIR